MAIAPFLFILVGVFCEFASARCANFVVPSEEEVRYFPEGADVYTHSTTHSLKRFKPLSDVILLCKKHKQGIQLCYVFIMRPSKTLKFQFVFGFNKCL